MVSFSTLAASAAAFAGAVQAGFYTTYPIGSDAINPGQSIQIKWRPDAQAPDLSKVSSYTLKFMTGGNLVQTTVATIGSFDISQTTVPFTVPNTAPGMYFLMYTANDGSGSSWSTRFSVGGGTSWYPDGVATGQDPSASDKPTSDAPTASDEPTSEQPPASDSPSPSKPGGDIGEPTDISGTDKPSSDGNGASQPPTSDPAPSESGKDNTPTEGGHDSTESNDGQPGNGSSEGASSRTSASSDVPDSSELGSISADSQEPSHASSSSSSSSPESADEDSASEDESSLSNEDTTSGSSAVRILSAAAVVAASVFMM
ncbi:hypothetical protein LPJ78_003141 [Coemansia sp. RSA 989]|nr:hypothetical protein BX667DRAFT_535914 [Coemansia mojavensis]KAJ1864802.1 hypothetical protein LPJ78_003141 [Coemansia sp. RSA 989]KAJ1872148.1 hypothetical protein LPJ55_003319 [Coemansia sp. RSA 990]KAJ2669252.1 hypothetical protein IWW42_004718 [Coemansia sp. RSA 1085]